MRKAKAVQESRTIFILLAAIVLVFAAWLICRGVFSEKPKETLYISDTKLGEITAIEIGYGGDRVSLTLDNGVWTGTDDVGFELDQSAISDIASAAASGLVAERAVNVSGALSEFGLDAPVCSVTLHDSAGAAVSYDIGAYNPGADDYYVSSGDADTAYLVPSGSVEVFLKKWIDLAAVPDLSELGYSRTTVSVMTVSGPDGGTFTMSPYDAQTGMLYSDEYKWQFTGAYPTAVGMRDGAAETLIKRLSSLRLDSRAAFCTDSSELMQYGLEEPAYTIYVKYSVTSKTSGTSEDKTLELYIGAQDENGGAYAMLGENGLVFLLSGSVYENLTSYAARGTCIDQFVCSVPLETVKTMTVSTGAAIYDIAADRSSGSALYTVNGKTADSAAFEDFYRQLRRLKWESVTNTPEAADASNVITFSFSRDAGLFSDMTLTLTLYDSSFYLASFGGVSDLLVSKLDVNSLINALKELA